MSPERHCDSVAAEDGPCPIGGKSEGGNTGIGNGPVLFVTAAPPSVKAVLSVTSAPHGSPIPSAESGRDCGLYCSPVATDDGPCPIGGKSGGGIGDGSRSVLLVTSPHGLNPSSAEAGHDCGMYTASVMNGVEAGSTGIVGGAVLLVTSALHG